MEYLPTTLDSTLRRLAQTFAQRTLLTDARPTIYDGLHLGRD
ncbi:hypothetical protein SESI111939_14650 [Serratia silvae]